MSTHVSTTPFGRRTLTYAQLNGQATARSRNPDIAVHKWAVFRDICAARPRLHVSERALAVLDALLSFHPETALTGNDLVVFPSNQQLSLRAHGMAPATLRRHLAVLVEAGLIARRDSPNGKRYARKDARGGIEVAYGFDLSPLVVRATQFAAWADEIRAEARATKQLRERITLTRRDIAKMIAHGQEQGIPLPSSQAPACDWNAVHALFRCILTRIPRTATSQTLKPLADELGTLAHELTIILEEHAQSACLSANESHSERHKQNSESDFYSESETASEKKPCHPSPPLVAVSATCSREMLSRGSINHRQHSDPLPSQPFHRPKAPPAACQLDRKTSAQSRTLLDTGMSLFRVGHAAETRYSPSFIKGLCRELSRYSRHDITSWGDLLDAVALVRPFLGISPSAWDSARSAMGEIDAAIVVACILERSDVIANPGGYLRNLAARATIGAFSVGPMLAALIKGQNSPIAPSNPIKSETRAKHQNFFRMDDYTECANIV